MYTLYLQLAAIQLKGVRLTILHWQRNTPERSQQSHKTNEKQSLWRHFPWVWWCLSCEAIWPNDAFISLLYFNTKRRTFYVKGTLDIVFLYGRKRKNPPSRCWMTGQVSGIQYWPNKCLSMRTLKLNWRMIWNWK